MRQMKAENIVKLLIFNSSIISVQDILIRISFTCSSEGGRYFFRHRDTLWDYIFSFLGISSRIPSFFLERATSWFFPEIDLVQNSFVLSPLSAYLLTHYLLFTQYQYSSCHSTVVIALHCCDNVAGGREKVHIKEKEKHCHQTLKTNERISTNRMVPPRLSTLLPHSSQQTMDYVSR